jgi:hypothetical protein
MQLLDEKVSLALLIYFEMKKQTSQYFILWNDYKVKHRPSTDSILLFCKLLEALQILEYNSKERFPSFLSYTNTHLLIFILKFLQIPYLSLKRIFLDRKKLEEINLRKLSWMEWQYHTFLEHIHFEGASYAKSTKFASKIFEYSRVYRFSYIKLQFSLHLLQ